MMTEKLIGGEKGANRESPIGILDSGVGGLSFLREAKLEMPSENWVYYGDQGHAPYGNKSREEIVNLVKKCVSWLVEERGIKAIVLACNTATAAAIEEVREIWPELVVVGMVPEIKTALRENEGEKVLMMATIATCGLDKYLDLRRDLDDQERVIEVPAQDLVALVERRAGVEEYEVVLDNLIGKYRNENVGAIVLGCSHFIFAREIIERYIEQKWGREIKFYGGIKGTLRRLKNLLQNKDLLQLAGEEGSVELWTTGEREKYLPVMEELLERGG